MRPVLLAVEVRMARSKYIDAYPPAVLLKVVLCAYARGVVSSRAIARLCEEHVRST